MIKVFIRHDEEQLGGLVGEFAPEQIKGLVELVKEFGLETEAGVGKFTSAQFVHYPDLEVDAFFEIVVSD